MRRVLLAVAKAVGLVSAMTALVAVIGGFVVLFIRWPLTFPAALVAFLAALFYASDAADRAARR